MQLQNKIKITLILIFLMSLLGPRLNSAKALSTSTDLATDNTLVPNSLNTQSGSTTSKSVDALANKDQSGKNDDPKSYIEFQTTGGAYQGTQTFNLPKEMTDAQIDTLELQVNYKGPVSNLQKWTWYLLDTNKNNWVKVGANDKAKANVWVMFRFRISNPNRFVDSNGQIQVLLRSNNSKGDAKLDYEAFQVSYRTRSAPDKKPQPATSPTPNAPSNSITATITPTGGPATDTAGFTSTPAETLPPADTATATPTSTIAAVMPTDTLTSTPQPSNTPFAAATSTSTAVATATSLPSNTPTPSNLSKSNTAVPTSTNTAVPATVVVATSTPTASAVPGATKTNVPTFTFTPSSVPPTSIPFTATYTPTKITLPANTATAAFTNTVAPTATYTALPSSTPTSTFTAVPTQPGNEYYVSVSGSDTNPGTQAQPWKTIQKAAASGNGTIYVLAGTYTGRVQVTRSNLNFQAQGEVVSTGGFIITGNGNTLQGFHVLNSTATDGGIVVKGNGNTIRNNRVENATLVGIEVEGSNHLIVGNEVWGTVQNGTSDADGMRFFGSGHIFRSNYIHDIHYGGSNTTAHIDCFQTWNDSSKGTASDIVVDGNTCINTDAQSSSENGQGFMLEGAKTTNITIRNNVIRAYHGVNAIGISNLTVENNTFIGDISNASLPRLINNPLAFYSGGNTNVVFQNNLLVDFNANIIVTGNAITGGHNLVYRSDGSKPRTDSAYQNSSDLWGFNPLFVNLAGGNYHLQPGSPAVDAGLTLPGVTTDHDGLPRPQGPAFDIGAFENSRPK